MMPLLAIVIAYLLGSIPFGYVLVKWRTGADVRSAGSGNIGATNVLRTTGRGAGAATLLLDIAKGYLAVWIAGRLLANNELWMSAAALAVMAGHAYPVFLKFQGGKAVATFVGAFLRLTSLPLIAALVVFLGGGRLDSAHLPRIDRGCRDISARSLAAPARFLASADFLDHRRDFYYLQTS